MSLFCAKTGAKTVYAVDACDIAGKARSVFDQNGYSNTIITYQNDIETLTLPKKADVLISVQFSYSF